jgi:SAM-dependent methyltransferase
MHPRFRRKHWLAFEGLGLAVRIRVDASCVLNSGVGLADLLEVLRCPYSRQRLRRAAAHALVTEDGSRSFPVDDGVVRFLPTEAQDDVREFYETGGWSKDSSGQFADTRVFLDTRSVALDFTRRCMARLNKHFQRGGEYLLDAGSGPIAHDELLAYGSRFERRICLDLSVPALKLAEAKLGDRGIYLQGDVTSIPIATGSVDAATCNHVIYQLPAATQKQAFLELWRVLKPGGTAVVVYWWPHAPLSWRIERVTRALTGKQPIPQEDGDADDGPRPRHEPQSLAWFEAQGWPFRYAFEPFRIVSNAFMKHYVSDDWRGRLFLNALFGLQVLAPNYCGRTGIIPVILIYKD